MPRQMFTAIALVLWKNAAYPPRIAMPVQLINAIIGWGCITHPAAMRAPPIQAIAKVLKKAGWQADTVDLWEINEAFAVVTLAAIQAHGLDPQRVNIHGGACALGHPIGASGARLVATLLGALREHRARRGIAALCIGGGEAVAMAIERV